jgi:serine phosphatase RsbU (regulator of sigma subunit)
LKDISAVLVEHIGEAEQFDDITMLAVRRLP